MVVVGRGGGETSSSVEGRKTILGGSCPDSCNDPRTKSQFSGDRPGNL